MSLLIEFDNLHYSLRILLLVRLGDTAFLEKLLPFLGETGELAGGRVETNMSEMNWIIWRANFWTLGGVEDEAKDALFGL